MISLTKTNEDVYKVNGINEVYLVKKEYLKTETIGWNYISTGEYYYEFVWGKTFNNPENPTVEDFKGINVNLYCLHINSHKDFKKYRGHFVDIQEAITKTTMDDIEKSVQYHIDGLSRGIN